MQSSNTPFPFRKTGMRIVLVMVFAAAVTGVWYLLFLKEPNPPVYAGKPLTHYLPNLRNPVPSDAEESIRAVKALGKESVPYLVAVLEQRESKWKSSFVRMAVKFRMIKPPMQAPLVQRQANAAAACTELGLLAQPAIPALTRHLHSDQFPMSMYAASALAHIGPLSIPALTNGLRSTNVLTRSSCVTVLSQFNHLDRLVPLLILALDDPNKMVRQNAAVSLGNFRRTELIVPALVKHLEDSDPGVRGNAAGSLTRFENKGALGVASLNRLLSDSNWMARHNAVTALSRINLPEDSSAINGLRKLLGDENPQVRQAALKTLNQLSSNSPTHVLP